MENSSLCELLPWDSDFFGLQIARVNSHYLSENSIKEILEWESTNSIDCLYFLSEFDDLKTINIAQSHDFQLVDIRITLELNLKKRKASYPQPAGIIIRQFQADDISILESIAKVSHTDTRFQFDQNFPKNKSASLYELWIRRSCEGFADMVWVAETGGQAAGYITCKKLSEISGQIGLVGVGEQARGQGIGKALVYAALDWFEANGLDSVEVVTQGRNISAQRLYQTCGFLTRSVQLWYHRWSHT